MGKCKDESAVGVSCKLSRPVYLRLKKLSAIKNLHLGGTFDEAVKAYIASFDLTQEEKTVINAN